MAVFLYPASFSNGLLFRCACAMICHASRRSSTSETEFRTLWKLSILCFAFVLLLCALCFGPCSLGFCFGLFCCLVFALCFCAFVLCVVCFVFCALRFVCLALCYAVLCFCFVLCFAINCSPPFGVTFKSSSARNPGDGREKGKRERGKIFALPLLLTLFLPPFFFAPPSCLPSLPWRGPSSLPDSGFLVEEH